MHRAPGRIVLALLLAACGSQPGPTVPALPSATPPTSAGPSANLASESPGPSASLEPAATPTVTTAPSAEPTAPAAGGWWTVIPPLAVPAAYLDLGFAGNGDLLVVGTNLITDPKLALWIARYKPDGTLVSKKNVDRRIPVRNADWIDIDPSNDTVVFDEIGSDGIMIARRIASASGATVASVKLHRAVLRIAIDPKGRMFATTPTYATSNVIRPCLLDRLGAGGGVAAGVDGYLETCETHTGPSGPLRFTSPHEIAVAASGDLVFVDEVEDSSGKKLGLRVVLVKPSWDFVRRWSLPLEWQWGDPGYGVVESSFVLAASSTEDVYLGETLVTADGSRSDGFRLRHFDTDGTLLETLGKGGDQDGIAWPSHPAVDGSDRLWVIDLDLVTKSYSVKVRG